MRKASSKRDSHNANLAAEYFVASQLFRLGYIVNVTYGNTKQIDLVVLHPDLSKKATVDVKGLKNKTNWIMPRDPLKRKDHFFILVSFKDKILNLVATPDVFIIPSRHVERLWGYWSGNKNVRAISYRKVNSKKYLNRWDRLFRDKSLVNKA